MTGRPRPAIAALPAYRPGRSAENAAADHGVADAIKLASNEAPFGPLPSVETAMIGGVAATNLYPDHGAAALRGALAAEFGLDVEHVTVGAGSAGLLQQILLAYVDPGEQVAMCWPSFEAYPVFSMLVEAEQVRVPLVDERYDLPALAEHVGPATKVAFIANPNNPTGTVVSTSEVERFLRSVADECLVVLDEAYAEFVTDPGASGSIDLLGSFPNLVITRTFSKAHGLAALRVGYALGHPDTIATIDRTLVPFAVNSLAQVAALASLEARDEMAERVALVVAERERVASRLRADGWPVPDSQGNFVWLPLGADSARVGVELERRGVVTRVFPETGVRATIADTDANERLLAALDSVEPRPDSNPQPAPDTR